MVTRKGVSPLTGASSIAHENVQRLERKVYSPQDVATLLGVSKEHIHRLIRAGHFPHKRVGRRIVVPCELFEKWLSASDRA
jgi:excisionase family DNA binding protein